MFHGLSCKDAVKEINEKFKNKLRSRGGLGFRNLKRILGWYDFDGNHKLDLEEFSRALTD